MNIDEILADYKKREEEPLYLLVDGRVVVGQIVDADNKLWYVIRDDVTYTIESAWNQQVIQTLIPPHSSEKTITLK